MNSQVAILMSVRNEEEYVDYNIAYHLDLGVDYIFIVDHCSSDGTSQILASYNENPQVIVIREDNEVFDHAVIINKLLKYAKENYEIDWFIFLDVDEFLSLRENYIHQFVSKLDQNNIPYATIGWANALFDLSFVDYICSPVHPIDTTKFYLPWPEKHWQEHGHFRKAIVRNHDRIQVVVGGHYVHTENNEEFFGDYHWNPFIIPETEARLLHFEMRGSPGSLYKKWTQLSKFEHDSTSSTDAPWLERIITINNYVKEYKDNLTALKKRWFQEHHTLFGTEIGDDRLWYDNTLVNWYGKYLRRKLEAGKIKSLCFVRQGHLGDVIMTEPIARYLSAYVEKIYLATAISEVNMLLSSYDGIYSMEELINRDIPAEAFVRLVYERSENHRTYIQAFFESVGFVNVNTKDIPVLAGSWNDLVDKDYVLLAPHTSNWEYKKRNWGYGRFIELKSLIEQELNFKVVVLEKDITFADMIILIKNCRFLVGNDSGPAIIAQSFGVKSFIIFGATHPKYLHLSTKAKPIYDKERHQLCSHYSREEEIRCCEEFCMDRIRVAEVFKTIKENL
jgi:glycosyltransferase involved in cell wall biosynthesis